ncbi:SDR family NAD(P)-dependent oxidoreductase [Bradyrhizobium sp. STM 3561]|uniref:SDR family NAD(P)-dependent oxidoreductase n=1 Tax=unclassified Bradyrhizobium TaxID=2631580 RepID=UPI00388DC728
MQPSPTLKSSLLEDQVAVVTGAGQGIGRAVAHTLAANGARVCLADVDASAVEAEAANIGVFATSFVGDLVEPGVPDLLIKHAIDAFGRLDIIVNAAGYYWNSVVEKMTDEQFQSMLDIHVVAPFRICRAAAPYMCEPAKTEAATGIERFRKIVNVSAIAATFGSFGGTNYATAKGALNGFTKSLALEWGRFKINVNAVAFGAIQTRFGAPLTAAQTVKTGGREIALGFNEKTSQRHGIAQQYDPAKVYEPRPISSNLVGRTGTVQEAADAIFWLSSPLANYVTGQIVTVSGGERGGLC